MFQNSNLNHLIESVIAIAVLLILRAFLNTIVRRYAKKFERVEHRTGLILKHISFGTLFGVIISVIFIWGVDYKNVGLYMSSVFAVIGIGFFAQWSILTNITSGIIMFFTFPYKIGDYIKIHDKDYPYEGFIEDIKTFHMIIKTGKNEIITYPNSLLMQKGVSIVQPEEIEEILMHLDEETHKAENSDPPSNIV